MVALKWTGTQGLFILVWILLLWEEIVASLFQLGIQTCSLDFTFQLSVVPALRLIHTHSSTCECHHPLCCAHMSQLIAMYMKRRKTKDPTAVTFLSGMLPNPKDLQGLKFQQFSHGANTVLFLSAVSVPGAFLRHRIKFSWLSCNIVHSSLFYNKSQTMLKVSQVTWDFWYYYSHFIIPH